MYGHLTGGYASLAMLPVWEVGLFFFVIGIWSLWPIRRIFEGKAYNIATSSEIGDGMLLFAFMIGQTALQCDQEVHLPGIYFAVAGLTSVFVGCGFVLMSAYMNAKTINAGGATVERRGCHRIWGSRSDNFHAVVIVPIITFAVFVYFPVVWENGTMSELCATGLFVFGYLATLAIDVSSGRAQQLQWLRDSGRYWAATSTREYEAYQRRKAQ